MKLNINDTHISELKDTELIRFIQERLNRLGHNLDIDGIVGPLTTAAWIQFKKDAWMANTEIVGTGSLLVLSQKSDDVRGLVTKQQVEAIWGNKISNQAFLDCLDCMNRFQINTTERIRHFLAQTGHESGGGAMVS